MVGPDPIFGVRPCDDLGQTWSVVAVTKHRREEGWPGVDEWYVISEDGRGNPIGMDNRGRVWRSDHDVGDIELLAKSFEGYIKYQFKLQDA
jgi:streptogramin lyase